MRFRFPSRGDPTPAMEPLEPRLLLDGTPLITEFMADNDETLLDTFGESSDWIEIYNPTTETINLDGWHLTDDRQDLTKWTFPAGVILEAAGDVGGDDYLVVFASNTDDPPVAGTELHTNFALSRDGEYLALVKPRGWQEDVVHEYYPTFPRQVEDVSYGLPRVTAVWNELVSSGAAATYHVPTPGEDVLTWTETGFDDSGWVDTLALDQSGVVITELATGDTRFVEIQNVIDQAADTAGWSVLVNDASSGNINDVHGVAWSLPASVAVGEVLYRTDDPGDAYWGSTINWAADGPGWAMILDSGGAVMDFVVWGYTATEIASLEIDYGGFTHITVADEANLPAGIGSQQDDQERNEVPAALGVGHRVGDPAGGIVDTPVNDLLLVLARGRNLGLLADRRPHAGQRRMTMNLHLVLKNQNFRGAALRRPFFSRPSCRRALWYAASSRLPFRVCFGRW